MKVVFLRKKKTLQCVCLAIAVFFAIFGAIRLDATAVYLGKVKRSLPIYAVRTEQKKVAITFDCAWGVEHTDQILAEMAREDVKCTFFMVEFWAKKYPEYVKKIDEAGHEIGTHSATHSYMSKLSSAQIENELTSSLAAISAVTGKKHDLFRAPYGDYNDRLIDTAKSMGIYTIQWDVDSLDWKDLTAEQIAMRVLSRVKSGSIILCHNNGKYTAKALPLIFADLKNKGYQFVPVGELIYKENYDVTADGTQIRITEES